MSDNKKLEKYSNNDKFIDRELSWLDFNDRVLFCANNYKLHPLNERFKFLAITCSNLDEFISVRFSSVLSDKNNTSYNDVLSGIKKCMINQNSTFIRLMKSAKEYGIEFATISSLNKNEKKQIHDIFNEDIFPILTPINIGSTNELPNIYSSQTCIAVIIKVGKTESLNIIPIDNNINKIYRIGSKIIMVEDIILNSLDYLFVNKEIVSSGYFRIVKDGNVILNHDTSKFILERMNDTLLQRRFSDAIFMQISHSTPKRLKQILINLFDMNKNHVFSETNMLDYTRFMSEKIFPDECSYQKFTPHLYETVEETYSIFNAISENDILLQHPYDSFDTVIKFIDHAAIDPNVVAIKQTLYRVSSIDSPIVKSLIKAAENGKHVSVLIEIKARFDEQRNIALIQKLKNAGVHVLLGLEYLKTHCKFCLVVRKEKSSLKIYSHIGTGNYNDKTANIYTDLSYFTAKQKIGSDLVNVFNILSGVSSPDEKLQRVFYAPVNLRSKLNKLIDREIEYAKNGKKAEIFLKLNSISDIDIVNRLYKAAKCGVKINIICRGVCSIVATKNISIKSIVGRFLEHSRIYYFRNGGDPEYFISSADLLTRNLDKRVEILLSLRESEVTNKLEEMIKVLKNDNVNSFIMNEDGVYDYYKGGDFDAHEWFIKTSETPTLKLIKKK